MKMIPRAITGIGTLSVAGDSWESFFSACEPVHSLSGERKMTSFDSTPYPHIKAAEIPDFDPAKYLGDKGLRTLDRLTKLMLVSSRIAIHDAGIKKHNQFVHSTSERVGFIGSNAYGSLEAITELDRVAKLEDARYINPAKFPNTVANSASGYVSIWEELRALNVAVSNGNCGALDAMACADVHLATDRADVILVGGAEALSETLYLAFQKLSLLEEATFLSEASVFFAVEKLSHAQSRKAHIYACCTGYGTSLDIPKRESAIVHASKKAMQKAIQLALDDAGISANEIDAVACSVSGLQPFSNAEREALREIFNETTPIAIPKIRFGETLGASGAVNMAVAIAWLSGRWCEKGQKKYSNAELTPSNELHKLLFDTPIAASFCSKEKPIEKVLITSMGFYGNASALVLERYKPSSPRSVKKNEEGDEPEESSK